MVHEEPSNEVVLVADPALAARFEASIRRGFSMPPAAST
jgi:hypothetical protein